jgi:hypothetical protein
MRREAGVLLLLASSLFSSAALAQERVVGLLDLPAIFGKTRCEPFAPSPVLLHAQPQGHTVGALVVLTPWTREPNGGCFGLTVGVQQGPSARVEPLHTMEHSYEEPGAVVLEKHGSWYRVKLGRGSASAWLESSAADGFYDLPRLFEGRLTYLTQAWDRRVFASPGRRARAAKLPPLSDGGNVPIRVRQVSKDARGLWFLIDIMSGDCGGNEPSILDRGWVPAYGKSADTTIWFYSRGC